MNMNKKESLLITNNVLSILYHIYQRPEDGLSSNKHKAPDVVGDVVDIYNKMLIFNIYFVDFYDQSFERRNQIKQLWMQIILLNIP